MKLKKIVNLLFCSFFCLALSIAYADPAITSDTLQNPRLQDRSLHVADPALVLQKESIAEINSRLTDLEQKTGIQSAVVMLPSIGDLDVFEFSQELFRKWGIGHKDKDDGLLVVYVSDQHVIRIHTGYGLEGLLPDAICKRIQMQSMIPFFKVGNVDEGMKKGIDDLCTRLEDSEASSAKDTSEEDSEFIITMITIIGTIIVILLIAAAVILHDFLRKCPQCGKRGTLKTVKEDTVDGIKHRWLYVTKKCRNCGYETIIKYDATDRNINNHQSGGGSSGGGFSGGGNGSSFGGGSSGGGGASSRW